MTRYIQETHFSYMSKDTCGVTLPKRHPFTQNKKTVRVSPDTYNYTQTRHENDRIVSIILPFSRSVYVAYSGLVRFRCASLSAKSFLSNRVSPDS